MSWRLESRTLKKFMGHELVVRGTRYQVLELFSEKSEDALAERKAVFRAKRLTDYEIVGIKVRVQLDPEMIRPGDREGTVKWAKDLHHDEVQGREYENPGGYIAFIVMSWMPGIPAGDYPRLNGLEQNYIECQVVRILNDLSRCGWMFLDGCPDQVIYERSTRAVSITGLSGTVKRSPEKTKIYSKDGPVPNIFGYGIWRT